MDKNMNTAKYINSLPLNKTILFISVFTFYIDLGSTDLHMDG